MRTPSGSPPEVVTVQLDEVEGDALVSAVVKDEIEWGNAIVITSDSFAPVNLGPNAFATPPQASGLVPFNVQNIGGNIYVTYAPSGVQNQRGAMR